MPAPSPSTAGSFRFGVFTLDPRTGVLDGPHGRANLPDQPLKILLALLEWPGELVTRDALRQELWPDNTFVDFEHSLNAAVKRLRDLLGDSADAPQFIETVPRRGYRFIATVDALSRESPQTEAANSRPVVDRAPLPARRAFRIWFGAFALVAAALAAWYALTPRAVLEAPIAPAVRSLARVTFGTGLDTDATWSPDGRRIAFTSDRSGNFDIWIQSLDGGEATRVTSSPEADVEPAWSPDGTSIAFRSERDGGGIYVTPALGGVARRLTSFGASPQWMPDGRDIFFHVATTYARAYLVSAGGGEPPREVLSAFLQSGSWEWMAPHPDGRISLIGWHRDTGMGLYTIRPDGTGLVSARPSREQLETLSGNEPHPERRFAWGPHGDALYVEAINSRIRTLWRILVVPRTLEWLSLERLTTGADHASAPAVSPDGTRVALSSQRRTSRVWIFPFDPGAGRLEGEGRPVTAEDVTVSWASLSRDGGALVYTAQPSGTDQVDALETRLDSGATTVLAPKARGFLVSPDGSRSVYLLTRSRAAGDDPPTAAGHLEYAVALSDSAGSEHLLTRWSDRGVMLPSVWTRDGRAVLGSYYVGTLADWPVALAVLSVTREVRDTPVRILLQEGGRRFWQASYSPDWRAIAFVAERPDRPGLEMGVMPADGTSPRGWTRLAADHEWADKPRWAPDGRTVYFLSRKGTGDFNVWGVRMHASTARAVSEPFQVTTFSSPALKVDPDVNMSEMDVRGRRLMLMLASATGNIWVLSKPNR